eukprot:m51a1_g5244 hypothetical protein (350) ;mRNA; r:17665-19773
MADAGDHSTASSPAAAPSGPATPAPSDTGASAAAPTRVLLLNTHLFWGTAAGSLYWPLLHRDEQRAREVGARVRACGADVAVLAEIWSTRARTIVADAARATMPHAWAPPYRLGFHLGPGLMVLSAKPIEWCSFAEYGKMQGYDRMARKGVATVIEWCSFAEYGKMQGYDRMARKGVATVVTGGVAYVFTHTQAGESPAEAACRAPQLELLARAAEAPLPAGARCAVVLGDLNVAESAESGDLSDEYAKLRDRLRAAGLVDAYRAAHPDRSADPGTSSGDVAANALSRRWGAGSRAVRNDFVFVPAGARVVAAEVARDWKAVDRKLPEGHPERAIDVSDHYPLFVTFCC